MFWETLAFWAPIVFMVACFSYAFWAGHRQRQALKGTILCPTCKGAGRIRPATPQQPAPLGGEDGEVG